MNKKWTPGQPLNSAAEVMQALLDGQTIVVSPDSDSNGVCAIKLVDGNTRFVTGSLAGTAASPNLEYQGWLIYTLPKRKVKSERWFAVLADKTNQDLVTWRGPYVYEAEARGYHPNALTYVRAECEVGVEE